MYRVVLVCDGLPAASGPEAAADITREFAEHRKWHAHAVCEWSGNRLLFTSENDFDFTGEATLDEFGDCVSAYVQDPGESSISIQSVNEFAHPNV